MPPVRPGSRWVSAGAIVGVIGALTGALLCCFALWSVTAQNSALLGFERTQNQLTILDEQMTHWARLYAATGDERWQVRHEQGKAEIKAAFRDAVETAPKMGLSGPMTQLTHADRMLAEIENKAIASVKAGDAETAIAMLTSTEHQTYRAMFERSLDELHRGVQDILQERLVQSYWLFGIALFVGIGCSGALVLIWRQVGRYTMRQAVALEKARDALASHAASLEDRIAERTADLEKAKETAERADRAKSEFLAAMSHEIRTPLNGVLGMADALAKSPLNERQVRMIQVIQESGDTLLALLNDVLDLAKIESGKMELENTDFDVEEAVRSAEAIFTERAQEKGLSFSVLVNPAAKGWFVGDPTRLRQILYNLISNALKFTQRGEVKVVVDAVPRLDGQVTMSFAVSDTGIGISDEVRARLFQKFVQADASTTRTYGGTGLGLAICRDLVGMMGGVITVDSEVGKGSTFRFEVPVARGNAPMPSLGVADTLTRADEGIDAPPLRILAADDNGHNRLVLKLMLEPLGLTPFFVENGREAVDAWQSQTFDLVLMDVQMPVLSGPDAAREIRALEALDGRPRTPIIALTANAMPQHVKECLESGMDAHVSKPIKPDNLFSTIHAVLDPSVSAEPSKDAALAAA